MTDVHSEIRLPTRTAKAAALGRDEVVLSDNLAYMAGLSDASMRLVVTSPPYNVGKSYERRLGLEDYVRSQKAVIDEAVRLLAPEGSICWQVGNMVLDGEVIPLDIVLYDLFKAHGLKLRNRIVWRYNHGQHCTRRLSGRYETILWFTREDYVFDLDAIRVPSKYPEKRHFRGPKAGQLSGNPLGKNPGDCWDEIPNVKGSHIEKTSHPCQFPVELVERLVLALTRPGDSVLDPYMGVGTSVVAAVKHGRHGHGCDVVEEYVEIARERVLELRAGTLRMRPMNRPLYDKALPSGGNRVIYPKRQKTVPSTAD